MAKTLKTTANKIKRKISDGRRASADCIGRTRKSIIDSVCMVAVLSIILLATNNPTQSLVNWKVEQQQISRKISTTEEAKKLTKRSVERVDWSTYVSNWIGNSEETPTTVTTLPAAKPEKLPDWRLSVDCSVFDFQCPPVRISQGLYEEYPFPYGRSKPHQHLYEWETLDKVPSSWIPALKQNLSLDLPPPRPIEYIYRDQVLPETFQKCVENAKTKTWKEQLNELMVPSERNQNRPKVQPDPETNVVAFTTSDYAYSFDMMHEVFEMNDNVVGFKGAFFMVAIDAPTLDLACRHDYPVIAWPSAVHSNTTEELKHSVANTKFEVSLELVMMGRDFLFYEMDVWFLRSPKPILQLFQDDILFSSHQNCPMCVNIGVYFVRSSKRTQEYFETSIQLAQDSPNTHDQVVMATVVHIGKHKGKYDYGKRWDPNPGYVPKLRHPVESGHFSPHEIIADERPYANQMAIAIHPLRESPLKNPHGKKMLAKEMSAWYGFQGPDAEAGYYSRKGRHRRFLQMDGHILGGYSTMMNWEFNPQEAGLYQDLDNMRWVLSALLAIARRTGRVLILPPLMEQRGIHFLWNLLDLESVEELGIDYRETTFANNPKAWYNPTMPFKTVARTALGGFKKDSTMFAEYMDEANSKVTRAWNFNTTLGFDQVDSIDAWWALHTSIKEVDAAELLLVNPHFLNQHYHRPLVKKLRKEHHKMRPNTVTGKGRAEYEIVSVMRRLRWCIDKETNHPDRIVGVYKSNDDCYGKGVEKH